MRDVYDNRCPSCVIAGEKVDRAHREVAEARMLAGVNREAAIVALRWLNRVGKLKPDTDDERALARTLEHDLGLQPANRRICRSGGLTREEYVEEAALTVRSALDFDGSAGKPA